MGILTIIDSKKQISQAIDYLSGTTLILGRIFVFRIEEYNNEVSPEQKDYCRLQKYLASEQQMGEVGVIIAGGIGLAKFRDALRIAELYGGTADNWVKKSSNSAYIALDGVHFQTHWVENLLTGQRVEFKTKICLRVL